MPATKTTKGLKLPCPKCGEADACITLRLADMNELTCQECDTEFTLEEVQEFIALWTPLITWIHQAPEPKEKP